MATPSDDRLAQKPVWNSARVPNGRAYSAPFRRRGRAAVFGFGASRIVDGELTFVVEHHDGGDQPWQPAAMPVTISAPGLTYLDVRDLKEVLRFCFIRPIATGRASVPVHMLAPLWRP